MLGLTLEACHDPRTLGPIGAPVVAAQLGVFFGGQVQQKDEIPFDLDPTAGRQGFRIEFDDSLRHAVDIAWEITRPEAPPTPAPRSSRRREPASPRLGAAAVQEPASPPAAPRPSVERGHAMAQVGESRFDRDFAFRPGDVLGTYNYRVLVDRRLVIDKSLDVYDPADPARVAPDDFQ
jgi:hypothetical protein